jgi:LacI family transcriptional regulator
MHIKRVAILIENSRAWGRGLLAGIAKYSRIVGHWHFLKDPAFFMPQSTGRYVERIKEFNPDGIIMRQVPDADEIIQLGKPVIISPHKCERFLGATNIIEDCDATGRMAAEHLLSKGFKNFAYCGFDDMFWSHHRCRGFQKRLSESNFTVSVYREPASDRLRIWEKERFSILKWLKSLPKPVGLFCCIDERGEQILDICHAEKIHVPEEVAVVGVDNDEFICGLSSPPLTSIAFDAEAIGYKAASLLDGFMKGKKTAATELLTKPAYVVERQSTDVIAIEDNDIAAAYRYIRANINKKLSVADIANATCMPRRTLERRFQAEVGNSIYKEIQNERAGLIEKMLIETNMSIAEIARAMDFADPNELTRMFCRCRNISPTSFRKKHKGNFRL